MYPRDTLHDLDLHELKFVVVALVVFAIAGVIGWWVVTDPGDDDSGCPLPLEAHTALLVDRSDPFSLRQDSSARVIFEKVIADLKVGERFSYYEITGTIEASTDGSTGERRMDGATYVAPSIISRNGNSLCQIALDSNEHGLNPVSFASQASKREEFRQRVDSIRDHLFPRADPSAGRRAADSPILEYVQQIGEDLRDRKALSQRLVIISDLGQHVRGRIDICDPQQTFAQFEDSEYFREVEPDLRGVAVDVYYVQRLGGRSEDCNAALQGSTRHRLFWREYFERAGATVRVNFRTLQE